MISQTSRAERTPVVIAVTDKVQVIQKFFHKPALVVFYSGYFSTASLNALNPSISPTDFASTDPAVKTKFVGAVRKSHLPVNEVMKAN